jgi:hypothetical protein
VHDVQPLGDRWGQAMEETVRRGPQRTPSVEPTRPRLTARSQRGPMGLCVTVKRDLRSNLGLSDAAFLITLSNESHLPCAAVAHNNDFVIAFTKLDKTLPRTDWCFFGEAIALVVAAARFSGRLLVPTPYSRGSCMAAGKFLTPFSE